MTARTLKEQIEAAFDYRGHVTLMFTDKRHVVGYLFNRNDEFVELILEGSAEKKKFPIADLSTIELSGVDEAAGKSYEDWIKKKQSSST